jgi:TolB protein
VTARRSIVLVGLLLALATGCTHDGAGAEPVGTGVIGEATPTTTPMVGGVLIYASEAPGAQASLTAWRPTGTVEALSLAVDDPLGSARISPNGKRIAWLAVDQRGGGTLLVANLDGSGRTELGRAMDAFCVEPVWSGDGAKVLTRGVDGHVGTVDTGTGAVTPLTSDVDGCHLMWSADGRAIAYSNGAGQVYVAQGDGSNARRVPRLGQDGGPARRRSFDLMSLSADGRYLALDVHTGDRPDGDVVRSFTANEIVDTTTGETRDLSVSGEITQAFFGPAGLVVRTRSAAANQVYLLDANLGMAASAVEPGVLKNLILIGYGGTG